jgi:hypothetical protein
MNFKFSQSAPTPDTLKTAQALIADLWRCGQLPEQEIAKLKAKAALNSSNSSQRPSLDSPAASPIAVVDAAVQTSAFMHVSGIDLADGFYLLPPIERYETSLPRG